MEFSREIKNILNLNQKEAEKIAENSEEIFKFLKENGKNASKTFEYIKKFALFIEYHKGERFSANISRKEFENANLYMIEPPCGSNTYIFDMKDGLFFIDCGFACFKDEMSKIFNNLFKNFEKRRKELFLTHCDIDHAGLCNVFDKIYATEKTYENFLLETMGEKNFRQQHEHHKAYNKIAEIISEYKTPDLEKIKIVGGGCSGALERIGEIFKGGIRFKIFEGNGGHIPGEAVLLWEKEKIAFCGDIFVNHKGYSKEQAYFNSLAPYLTKSVNVNSEKARVCREAFTKKFEDYLICPGHGSWIKKGCD